MRIYGNRLTYDEPRPSSLTELQWLAAPAWTLAQICVLANMQRMWAVRETEKGDTWCPARQFRTIQE